MAARRSFVVGTWYLVILLSVALGLTLPSAAQAIKPPDPPLRIADAPTGNAPMGEAAMTTALPHVGPDIPIAEIDNVQHLPAVAYNWRRNEYLVVWHNQWGGGGRDIYAQRLDGHGDLIGSGFAVTYGTNQRAQPDVAYDPDYDRYLVVWIYDASGTSANWDIYGRFIPWYGPDPAETEFPISTWTSDQWVPKVVYNEHPQWPEFLVVWNNLAGGGVKGYVSGRRVFADGSGFPPGDGFTIVSSSTDHYINPDVAYNLARNEYLVVYGKNDVDVAATRLEANGNILGGGTFGIAGWPSTEHRPAVAACHTADQYFVGWQSLVGTSPNNHYDIYGRFVTGDGQVGNDVQHLASRTINEQNVDVACNPGAHRYMVVWQEQYSDLSGPDGVSGRMVYTSKTTDGDFVIVAPYTNIERVNPAVASGPPGYLTVWAHDRYNTSHTDVHGRMTWPNVLFIPLTLRGF